MAAGFLTTFKPIFDTYCFTIVSLFAAFSGANIGSKFVQGKQKATIQITGTAQKVQPVEEIEEPTEE